MPFSERLFIRQIQQLTVRPPVTVGIGDDGAVIDCRQDSMQIVVTDMLIDQVHFDASTVSGYDIGYKSIAVNLSDLAAMAAVPTAAFISLALPEDLRADSEFLDNFYRAVNDLAQKHDFTVAGGDTNRIDGPLVVNVCLTGVPMGEEPVLRSGAKVGDLLVVTGPLGGSLPSQRHLRPIPRLAEAKWAVTNLQVNAMMDVSDGLALDLHRMLEESGVGGILFEDHLPIHDDVSDKLETSLRVQRALSDGEDFELLMAIDPVSFPSSLPSGMHFTVVGRVMEHQLGVMLQGTDGRSVALPEAGFQH
ncbi:MAG: thiamine-phosphate kinase [Fuerstiella sp.]